MSGYPSEINIEDLFEDYNEERLVQICLTDPSKNINYSHWAYNGTTYTPIQNTEIFDKLKPNVYKVSMDNSGSYILTPQDINSDILYDLEDNTMKRVLSDIKSFWDKKDKFKEYKLIHKRGILLEGIGGTGKTVAITLLTRDVIKSDGIVFIINNVNEFFTYFNFIKIFRKIEPDTPIITVIEDIDNLIEHARNEILDLLDGKTSIEHHVVIMTSNDSSDLPDSLLRPSRIDLRVLIDLPSNHMRKLFFEKKGINTEDIEKYVSKSKGLTISHLKELFIGTYILGNDFDFVLNNLKNPISKQNYNYKSSENQNFKYF